MSDPRPLGVFDSGIGGLTVFRALAQRLPGEQILYLGDTARVPYGTKSPETVTRYTRECARFLLHRNIKALVVACNTASALALPALMKELSVPTWACFSPAQRLRRFRPGESGHRHRRDRGSAYASAIPPQGGYRGCSWPACSCRWPRRWTEGRWRAWWRRVPCGFR